MTAPNSNFEALLERIGRGSEQAVWELLERYSSNLRRAINRRLGRRLSSKLESDDLVQSVWKSLLRKGAELEQIQTEDQFVAYLVGMAKHKASETHRHFSRQAYDIGREVPPQQDAADEDGDARPADTSGSATWETPSTILHHRENWERMATVGGEQGHAIIQLRLQGKSQKEIADVLGTSRSDVQRILSAMLESLEL